VGMLDFATSLLKTDQKYRRYLKIAGLFLVFGYISLLTFIFVAFNKHDRHYYNAEPGANAAVSQPLEMKKKPELLSEIGLTQLPCGVEETFNVLHNDPPHKNMRLHRLIVQRV
jgi:hypothetical protein